MSTVILIVLAQFASASNVNPVCITGAYVLNNVVDNYYYFTSLVWYNKENAQYLFSDGSAWLVGREYWTSTGNLYCSPARLVDTYYGILDAGCSDWYEYDSTAGWQSNSALTIQQGPCPTVSPTHDPTTYAPTHEPTTYAPTSTISSSSSSNGDDSEMIIIFIVIAVLILAIMIFIVLYRVKCKEQKPTPIPDILANEGKENPIPSAPSMPDATDEEKEKSTSGVLQMYDIIYDEKKQDAMPSAPPMPDATDEQKEKPTSDVLPMYDIIYDEKKQDTIPSAPEIPHKIADEYNKENKQYLYWQSTDIVNWILNLDTVTYSKYDAVLRRNMKAEGIDGQCLMDLNVTDLHRMGITLFKDKRDILRAINELTVVENKEVNNLEKSDEKKDDKECIICMDGIPEYAPYPCNHLCLCSQCKDLLSNQKCPICQAEYQSINKIYV